MAVNNGLRYQDMLTEVAELPMEHALQGHHSQANMTISLSFQLMTRAEPAELVIATIQSLLAVKAPHDEIIIVDNNHTETSLYQPLAAFCASLDPKLQVYFYHIDAVEGFKAGALNLALGLMNPNCTHLVVVDSDYQALPHARVSMTNAINRYPNHTLIQFPQFYRSAGQADIHSELNHYFNHHLYRPFNRDCALSTGTYAVIRRYDLLKLGGWSGASLTEDAQMGILLHQKGFCSTFIPEVIATGLLPSTLDDLLCQRRRWIYGNMQVLNNYVSWPSLFKKPRLVSDKSIGERSTYTRAHLSQLSAWVNFTGFFILLQICTLLVISIALFNFNHEVSLLTPLYLVYASYAFFLVRRLWAYCQDEAPLNKQVNKNHQTSLHTKLRAWLMHINFWELGALSWLPVLWGSKKPFICTPKKSGICEDSALQLKNIAALPKLLLVVNAATALVVAPFSPFYAPVLFMCAVLICVLKLWAAKVALDNFVATEPKTSSISVNHKPAVVNVRQHTKLIKTDEITTAFKDKKTMNS
ncbi:glycosyltransferase family 2 protein [Psychrobacter namhaensis]|jgi:glycosyltransferase involved in cell wall biosynthesis|uniref:glycosyltransferase family 2 protein n=1 Tax=Psychrobacter namhaensis TaxID=292734 RepID=UPI003D052EDE